MVGREILAVLKANEKWTKSPKLEGSHPPKLVCMHFTSTSTCMNFLSQFYFLTPWTIVHGSKGKFGQIWKVAKSPKPEGLHAFHVNLYLHEFFEPIPFFDPMDYYSPWLEGKLWLFWRQHKHSNISKTRGHTHQNRFACISRRLLLAWIFWANSIFWPHGL